jgi:hypothetical protein
MLLISSKSIEKGHKVDFYLSKEQFTHICHIGNMSPIRPATTDWSAFWKVRWSSARCSWWQYSFSKIEEDFESNNAIWDWMKRAYFTHTGRWRLWCAFCDLTGARSWGLLLANVFFWCSELKYFEISICRDQRLQWILRSLQHDSCSRW